MEERYLPPPFLSFVPPHTSPELLTNSRLRHRGFCFPKTHLEKNKRKGKCRRNIFFLFGGCGGLQLSREGAFHFSWGGGGGGGGNSTSCSLPFPSPLLYDDGKKGNFPFSFREKLFFLLFLFPPPSRGNGRRGGGGGRGIRRETDQKKKRPKKKKEARTPFPLFFPDFFYIWRVEQLVSIPCAFGKHQDKMN